MSQSWVSIETWFDDFSFHSRFLPVAFASVPLIIFILLQFTKNNTNGYISLVLFVTLIFATFCSKVARELGKREEKKIYEELGAMPTTIILRFTDSRINELSKTQYHKIISKRSGIDLPISKDSENDFPDSDKKYEAAINWMRTWANSNREKAPLVYKELKEYNFWRNIYGIRNLYIFIFIVIAIREVYILEKFSFIELIEKPYPIYISFILMVASIIIFLFFIRKKIVVDKAFDYAKTLVESCTQI